MLIVSFGRHFSNIVLNLSFCLAISGSWDRSPSALSSGGY
uniref:Uncharacterized protein n=1 Tax=Rhizobium rhizogenes TaxID=359 RepID=A0A7S4ZUV7_RHIRH|nr:hypothetical protein pC6.5d_727 [Rhizobium rhizogenes]